VVWQKLTSLSRRYDDISESSLLVEEVKLLDAYSQAILDPDS